MTSNELQRIRMGIARERSVHDRHTHVCEDCGFEMDLRLSDLAEMNAHVRYHKTFLGQLTALDKLRYWISDCLRIGTYMNPKLRNR